ncbi:unknown [Coprococcus sp. CAG:782]|nr:unknown [Coprococcus sp. CAG:782]
MATKKWNIIICEHFTTVDPQIKILHVFTIFVKILDRKDLYAIIMHVVLKTTCGVY